MLASPATGSAEKEYAEGLNDAWDTALRSLWCALRDGRLASFYCRAEPPLAREANAASGSGFTMLWYESAPTHSAPLPCGSHAVLRCPLRIPFRLPHTPLPCTHGLRTLCAAGATPQCPRTSALLTASTTASRHR